MNFFRALWEDFKAFRRGEKRVAPRQVRGRVYARKGGGGGSSIVIGKTPKATLTMTVTRANGDVETIKVPAKVKYNG